MHDRGDPIARSAERRPTDAPGSSARTYRLQVLSRIGAAVLGGYLLTNAAAVFLVRLLPMPRADAALAMTLLSFALYAAAVMYVFAARSAARAWIGMLGPAVLLAGLGALLGSAA